MHIHTYARTHICMYVCMYVPVWFDVGYVFFLLANDILLLPMISTTHAHVCAYVRARANRCMCVCVCVCVYLSTGWSSQLQHNRKCLPYYFCPTLHWWLLVEIIMSVVWRESRTPAAVVFSGRHPSVTMTNGALYKPQQGFSGRKQIKKMNE